MGVSQGGIGEASVQERPGLGTGFRGREDGAVGERVRDAACTGGRGSGSGGETGDLPAGVVDAAGPGVAVEGF